MGVLPLEFTEGQSQQSLGLTGEEQYTVRGIAQDLVPHKRLEVEVVDENGRTQRFPVIARIDTLVELDYFRHGGILEYVLRQLVGS